MNKGIIYYGFLLFLEVYYVPTFTCVHTTTIHLGIAGYSTAEVSWAIDGRQKNQNITIFCLSRALAKVLFLSTIELEMYFTLKGTQ